MIRPLARGGMGMLYVVEQVSVGAERALKVMHGRMAADARLRERFLQEARASARIESDHVVQVIAAGVDEATGTPWMVQELLRGQDLAALLVQRGSLGLGETLEVFRQLCHALGAAHRAGLVHRDLKPENIFLANPRRDGSPFTVKLLDFGIAKILEDSATGAGPTTTALGSPLWMAPEQAQKGHVSPATDVWALGLVAFTVLTGRTYWHAGNRNDGNVQQVLREIFVDALESPTARAVALGAGGVLPPGFDDWFFRCVARDPGQRFRDATEALAALTPVLTTAGAAPFTSITPPPTAAMATPAAIDPGIPVMPPPGILVGSGTRVSLPPPPVAMSAEPAPPPGFPSQSSSGYAVPPTATPSRPPATMAWTPDPSQTPGASPSVYGPSGAWSPGSPSGAVALPPASMAPSMAPPMGPVPFSGAVPAPAPAPRRGRGCGWLVALGLVVLTGGGVAGAYYAGLFDDTPADPVPTPHPAVRVAPPGDATVSVGWGHSCALGAGGTVQCWGQNRYGQLGDGTVRDRSHAAPAVGVRTAAEVSAGYAHTCARVSDGTVLCWGSNASGQLGDGTLVSRASEVTVAGVVAATQVAAGEAHTCARMADGTVRCWGRNEHGQLGLGDGDLRMTATSVPGLTSAVQVATGAAHTCVLRADGSVLCWGANDQGQLGVSPLADHRVPTAVPALPTVLFVAAAGQRTCAVCADTTVRCWGRNDVGQLGDGTTTGRAAPVTVAGIGGAVSGLALGPLHSCARLVDGTVRCWGSNAAGELGDGTHAAHPLPAPVTGLTDVTDLALADGHACARRTDGTLHCWGWNAMGQLGDGTTTDRPIPVATVAENP